MPKIIVRGASFVQEIMGAREIEMEAREGSTVETLMAALEMRFEG